MQELQGQYLVDLGGVVPISLDVAPQDGLEPFGLEVWPRKGSGIKEHFPNVSGKSVPVPDSEMRELVPPKKEAFQTEGRKEMIDPGHPLRHPVIVGILRLAEELEDAAGGHGGEAPCPLYKGTAIRPDTTQGRVAVGDQPQANVVVRKGHGLVPRRKRGGVEAVHGRDYSRATRA